MEKLKFALEVVNGATVILGCFLIAWLSFHLYDMIHARGEVRIKSVLLGVAGGVSLAGYLLIEQVGIVLNRLMIWLWRMSGAAIPFTDAQDTTFGLGAFLIGVGILLMIRLLSRPRFGEWPWIIAGIVTASYIATRTIIHYAL
jgi:hypothetical protein